MKVYPLSKPCYSLQSWQRQPLHRWKRLLYRRQMIVIATLLLDQTIFNAINTHPFHLHWTDQPLWGQEAFDTPACCPLHSYLLVRAELVMRSEGNRGSHAKARSEPFCNLVMASAWMLHARVEEFSILCVERNDGAHIMSVECFYPAVHEEQVFFSIRHSCHDLIFQLAYSYYLPYCILQTLADCYTTGRIYFCCCGLVVIYTASSRKRGGSYSAKLFVTLI